MLKFFSCLGAGKYKNASYYMDDKGRISETKYIQRAIIDLLPENEKPDKILIATTEKAYAIHWEPVKDIVNEEKAADSEKNAANLKNTADSEKNAANLKNTADPEKNAANLKNTADLKSVADLKIAAKSESDSESGMGLKYELEQAYPQIPLEQFGIPDGKNEEEIWGMFHAVLNHLEEGDEVIADITHAFRFIPMIMISVLNYAKTVKHITVKNIYYGAFEAKDENGLCPVLSLGLYDTLLDWTQATNTFLRYGNSGDFTNMANENMKLKLRHDSSIDEKKKAGKIQKFSASLKGFTENIETCRGAVNEKRCKSILKEYQILSSILEEIIQTENRSLEPLIPLLDIIKKETEMFHTDAPDLGNQMVDVGMATAKWCIEKGMVPMALTAMAETIASYVCVMLGYSEKAGDKDFRENVAVASLAYVTAKARKKDFAFRDSLTEEERDIIRSAEGKISIEFVGKADAVKALRNDVNHFGLNKTPKDSKDIIKNVEKYYQELIAVMN